MELHNLKPIHSRIHSKRVGRGGKRGTTSGHGTKGQKGRAGARIRPGFRGGDNPIWKLFPKQRGASKKTDIKHRGFRVHAKSVAALNIEDLEKAFVAGDIITRDALKQKGLVRSEKKPVKILGDGELTKALTITGIPVSKTAREKITKAHGTIS